MWYQLLTLKTIFHGWELHGTCRHTLKGTEAPIVTHCAQIYGFCSEMQLWEAWLIHRNIAWGWLGGQGESTEEEGGWLLMLLCLCFPKQVVYCSFCIRHKLPYTSVLSLWGGSYGSMKPVAPQVPMPTHPKLSKPLIHTFMQWVFSIKRASWNWLNGSSGPIRVACLADCEMWSAENTLVGDFPLCPSALWWRTTAVSDVSAA